MMHQKILILDFGSPLTQLIARRVRNAGVLSEVFPADVDEAFLREQINKQCVKGIILSGANPDDVTTAQSVALSPFVFLADVPVLAIGHGMHVMAKQLGGDVTVSEEPCFGQVHVTTQGNSPLFATLSDGKSAEGLNHLDVWMSEGAQLNDLPAGFTVIGTSKNCAIAAIADEVRRFYGVQFHPEVTNTKQGEALLRRFVLDICDCDGDWSMAAYAEEMIDRIREEVGDEQVLLALSGGVDSSVAAVLIHRAIGSQLTCVFVDHGMLRLFEAKQVMDVMHEHLGLNIIHINAVDRFMKELQGVTDPEQKRKIIGRVFIEIFQEEAAKLNNAKWLAQGTIYPDVIESLAGKHGVAVKSHHNVGGLPDTLSMKLLEPLRELFKDEVRELGVALGLPAKMVYRHPFPGPGLGVRILGEVNQDYADILRRADAIFVEELRNAIDVETGKNWYDLTSQAFAVFLPVKSVGVSEGSRVYEYVVALRAIQTNDFMNARWAPLPYELLGHISNRIINEVRGISRVVYDISGKPPATIEWE
ncbi:GMP synthase [Oligella sp. MSHR50489EDL]